MPVRLTRLLFVLLAALSLVIVHRQTVGEATTADSLGGTQPLPKDRAPAHLQEQLQQAKGAASDSFGVAEVGGAGDRAGDVPYCQGDIVGSAVDNQADQFVIGHATACASNPYADPAWTTGATHIIWSIDVNGDAFDDYTIHYNHLFELRAAVYYVAGGAFTQVCEAAPGWDGSSFFHAILPAGCVGSPASVRIQSYMVWDENPFSDTCICPYDVAPDGFGFSEPIARSACSATTAGPGANNMPVGGQAFTPLPPARIYDTRTGVGGTTGLPLGPNRTSTVRVTGVGGVPSTDVSAVVLNVTATGGTAPSYLSVTPAGVGGTSSVNFLPNQDVANLVTVPVGADGNVSVYNASGCAHVVLDVFGYYGSSGTSRFNAIDPARLLDTRTGNGTGVMAPVGASQTLTLQVAGRGGVPVGATAAVLNVTATEGSLLSYLSVTPLGGGSTSNLNFVAGQDRPNLVTVPLAPDGTVRIYNNQGVVHVVADVMGWYGATGSVYSPVPPARVVDSRNGTGGIFGKLAPSQTAPAQVAGLANVPSWADAVLLNVTATEADGPTYLAVTPHGATGTSNLNVRAGQDIANAVAVKVADDGPVVRLFNGAAPVHVVVDIAGWFENAPI